MLGLFLLLFVVGSNVQRVTSYKYPPSYVQARNAFAHARLFIQKSLPHETRDLTDPEARKHFSFSIMAGKTIALVKAFDSVKMEYNPLKILEEKMPETWGHYNEVSKQVNDILAEATFKIKPITSLIDTLCDRMDSVEVCNMVVAEHVLNHSFLKSRAALLLQLGKTARILNQHAKLFDDVAAANEALPFLLKIVDTTPFEIFIAELTRVYELMRIKTQPSDNSQTHRRGGKRSVFYNKALN